ncbi:MAG: mechanosensitive ion channel [Archangiaceae bacterium]|nr:mechanosensitive ion channel [Archangiaceae bacterium]
MLFFETLANEALEARTLWILGGLLFAVPLVRRLGHDQPRLKAIIVFAFLHVISLLVSAGFEAAGSTFDNFFRTPCWVFGGVSFVGAMATLLFTVVLPRVKLAVPQIVQDVSVALLSIIAAVTVAGRAGVNLSGLIATSAVLTAVLGFSLQDTIANIAGGLGLQTDNSIEVGDWIRIGTQPTDINGRVVRIRWRYTAIETRNWETVLVPNRVLMNSSVMVLGRRGGQPQQWRRWVYFHVDFRFQPGDVIDVVQSAVRGAKIERLAKDPQANCVMMDMAESYGRYAVRYWLTDLAADDPTDSEVRQVIFFALERAGMKPALPAHAVFLTQETEDRQAIKTQKQLARRRRVLEVMPLFAPLSDEEKQELARGMKYAPFARGEVMTRQGSEAHWLYLLEEGRASVKVSDGVTEREVAKLSDGSFFGEMSLLTGEPRSATVIAESEVECFRLDKVTFQRVIEKRPELMEQVATLLAKRRVELQAAREGLDADTAKARQRSDEVDLLERMKRFFGLN